MDSLSRVFSTLLAGLFTIVMVFATVIVPVKLHPLLSTVITRDISSFPLLWYIGVVALCLLVVLVVAGFILEKTRFSSVGSFLLYLPTLSYFVFYMFWMYGIGILRVLWLPILGPLDFVLPFEPGKLVYLPQLIFLLPSIGRIARYGIVYGFLGVGIFVFLLGTEAWLYGKKKEQDIIDAGVYKYSRHPQYLGFILWSYGASFQVGSVTSGAWGYVNPGFPWVVSVLLVVCVALFEEQIMVQEHEEEYRTYREETPFLFPLPLFLVKLVTSPMRLLLGKPRPTRKREIAYVFFLYLGLYLLAEFLFHYLMLALLGIT